MLKIAKNYKSTQREKIILIALLAMLISFLYLKYILRPHFTRVSGSFVAMKNIASKLKNAAREIARMPVYERDITAYEDKVNRYEKMLPAEQEIPALLEILSAMAKESGVKIVAITPVMPKENTAGSNQAYQEIPILINARSGYHELGNFLASLENSDRFIKVVDISIRTNSLAPRRHDVELLVLTYILAGGR